MNDPNAYASGMADAYLDGALTVPYALLRAYRALKLSDTEGMLLLQLLAFRQMERNEFPTIEQLQIRLEASPDTVGQAIRKLMRLGYISIDEVFDNATGIQSEKYNLTGLFRRLGEMQAADLAGGDQTAAAGAFPSDAAPEPRRDKPQPAYKADAAEAEDEDSPHQLFRLFEQEFGRPISPMEIEMINAWLDQDRYPAELIRFALKESVFAGKLHFNYIDRILLEWARNRVANVDEAKVHRQKYRQGK